MSSVVAPVLQDAHKYQPLGVCGMQQQLPDVVYPRTRLTELHDIRTTGDTYYTHGGAKHRAALEATQATLAPDGAEADVPLGATTEALQETLAEPPAEVKRRDPVCIDYEDRFVHQPPEVTNAQEAATRVYSVNGILTKNNPYEAPVMRTGGTFTATIPPE